MDRVIHAVYEGVKLPLYVIFLTPLFTTIIGLLLRKAFPNICYDLPGIILSSTGLMIGLMAILVEHGF